MKLPENESTPETPPPSKRPRRSATLPKPELKPTETTEPKSKKPKNTPKKEKATPKRKKSKDSDKEPEPESEERQKKISTDSAESVIEEFIDADYLKGQIYTIIQRMVLIFFLKTFKFCFITVVNLGQGEYIAVRTEGHDFYLAEVLQDVLEKDNVESFKVQWFDISGEDNVYVRSYEDTVDARSVVCPEVKLKKESGGRFRLQKPMLDKIKKRIKRALQGNTLSSSGEDNDDDDEDRVDKAKPLKLPGTEMRTFRHRSSIACLQNFERIS